MNAFDCLITGDIDNIEVCFEMTHFNERLKQNRINIKDIERIVLEEEPKRYSKLDNGNYEAFYTAPDNKDYEELRLVFNCDKNKISLITIMGNRHLGRSKKEANIKKMRDKAHQKVNRNFR